MGLNDAAELRQELDILSTEFQRRLRAGESPEDLLATAQALEAGARHLDIPDFVAVALMRRAEILAGLERDPAAVAALEEARRVLGGWRQQDLGVRVLALLAETYARHCDWPRVSELCREGIDLTERFRYKISSPYLQSGYLQYRIGLYAHGVRAAYELGDFELMLTRAELSKCRSLRRRQPSEGTNGPATSTEQAFTQVCAQIDAARSRGRGVADLLFKRRTLWDLLVIERLQARTDDAMPDFTLSALRASLTADEAVLYYYWLTRDTLLVVLLDSDACHAELKTVSSEERQQAQTLAHAVANFKDENRSVLDEAAHFAERMIPKAAGERWTGKRRLLISPHRMLHSLPFHAARWEGAWLIERFAITYVPNLTSVLRRPPPSNPPRVCLLGISDYAVLDGEKPLRRLPQAETEVAGIAAIWRAAGIPVTLLVGADAQEKQLETLRRDGGLGRFSCLHFAVHGQNIESDTPMESHLFLRDSLLDGLEIANWKLDADLVVLSACCSGQRAIAGRGLAELPGDEMFGLSAAFFAAGARRIFSTLWPVDSYAAVPITTELHRQLAAGVAPELAWQAAVRVYLKNAGALKRRIYYWAPFFLSAVGRPGAEFTRR